MDFKDCVLWRPGAVRIDPSSVPFFWELNSRAEVDDAIEMLRFAAESAFPGEVSEPLGQVPEPLGQDLAAAAMERAREALHSRLPERVIAYLEIADRARAVQTKWGSS